MLYSVNINRMDSVVFEYSGNALHGHQPWQAFEKTSSGFAKDLLKS